MSAVENIWIIQSDTEESDVPSNHAQEEIPDETIEELEALIVQGKKIGRC